MHDWTVVVRCRPAGLALPRTSLRPLLFFTQPALQAVLDPPPRHTAFEREFRRQRGMTVDHDAERRPAELARTGDDRRQHGGRVDTAVPKGDERKSPLLLDERRGESRAGGDADEILGFERVVDQRLFGAPAAVHLRRQRAAPSIAEDVENDRQRLARNLFGGLRRINPHSLLEVPRLAARDEAALLE